MNNKYQPVIGLEVHVELKTKSKMFCECSADYFGHKPNTHVCPVCLGLPGALPVPNKTAIEWCVMIGLALNCEIPLLSKFDRKNYFYPDLPKGYQISQYDKPFCIDGWVDINRHPELVSGSRDSDLRQNDKKKKKIGIRRVHMEEDTAKLMHQQNFTLIDFNRSGVPLVEIVTEPDFESAEEVVEYLKKLQQIVRYLDVSNADMEKGDMRLEPNVSLHARNTTNTTNKQILPIYKVEIKNINSFRFVEKAINYEIERQKKLLESGKKPEQETRGWNESKNATVSQRTKEEAHDYRYFPEPDMPPIRWTESKIETLKSQIPELPDEKLERFQKEFGLSNYDAEILTREKETADYFEEALKVNHELGIKNQAKTDVKTIANWIINKKINIDTTLPAKLIQTILSATQTVAINEEELEKIINDVLKSNQKAVEDYKNGKESAIMFLVGQVMRQHKEKIDTGVVKKTLLKKLH